jgi:hypothetical protein
MKKKIQNRMNLTQISIQSRIELIFFLKFLSELLQKQLKKIAIN